jgi:hypothetical protein
MFYGLGLMKNPKLSKENVEETRGWLKHSGAIGIAMTMQSFKNIIKKEYFTEKDFDMVIIDGEYFITFIVNESLKTQ